MQGKYVVLKIVVVVVNFGVFGYLIAIKMRIYEFKEIGRDNLLIQESFF